MTTYFILAFAVFALVYFGYGIIRGYGGPIGRLEDLNGQTIPVDIVAFRNLVDPAEEAYLRGHLSAGEFRRIQRKRILAAASYVHSAATNASVLLRVGQAARSSADPQVAAAARELVENALQVRVYSIYVAAKLYLAALLPGSSVSLSRVIDQYQNLTETLARVTRLQSPTMTSRIASVV